jgi:hypothetical protein
MCVLYTFTAPWAPTAVPVIFSYTYHLQTHLNSRSVVSSLRMIQVHTMLRTIFAQSVYMVDLIIPGEWVLISVLYIASIPWHPRVSLEKIFQALTVPLILWVLAVSEIYLVTKNLCRQ